MRVDEARTHLIPRAQLERRGSGARQVAAEVAAGRLRRVHPGWYVDGATWRSAFAETRHLFSVVAAAQRIRSDRTVVSHHSAAVAWELPLYRLAPRLVHVSGDNADGCTGRQTLGVARHAVAAPPCDRVEIDGILCTSLERTVFDMLRAAPAEAALAIADAGFRRAAWDDRSRTYDVVAAERLCEALATRVRAAAGGRGIRQARRLLPLADGRAQLPGESVSRLRLDELGFAEPRLQVAIPGPAGRTYYCDFGLDDVGAWGEFDGVSKYLDPDLTGGLTAGEAVMAEKARENWIVATTGRRIVRWGSEHIDSATTFERHLATYGIRPPR